METLEYLLAINSEPRAAAGRYAQPLFTGKHFDRKSVGADAFFLTGGSPIALATY